MTLVKYEPQNEYDQQAHDFMEETNTKMYIEYLEKGFYFDDDKVARDIYKIKLERNGMQYTFTFGQSIARSGVYAKPPTPYDILACVEKYEPYGDEWDFAKEFGYDIHDKESYKKVLKIFNAVERQYAGIERLFGDVMEQLQEIQ